MTQNSQVAPLETARVQIEIPLERAEQLARLGLIPDSFLPATGSPQASERLTLAQYHDFLSQYLSCCALDNAQETLQQKKAAFKKFDDYLRVSGADAVGADQVRGFLRYIKDGHTAPGGRWGNGSMDARYRAPVSARTIEYYFIYIQGLFSWAVGEEKLERDPTRKIEIEKPKPPPIIPFTAEQVERLEMAARESYPKLRKRNTAAILFMYDTGLRASEFCNMTLNRLEFDQRGGGGHVTVTGKGNKRRQVPFGKVAKAALRAHITSMPPSPGMKIWVAKTGTRAGDALQPNGLRQLYHDLGKAASISGVRCSPHTMRHMFALTFLRNGGNLPTLQHLLGHARVEQTMKYLHIVDLDADEQHSKYSPADNLKAGGG